MPSSGPTYAVGHAPFLWRDGEIVPWDKATVHVTAVGHNSVAGVFEGVKAYRTAAGALRIFRAHDHMRRFEDSCRILIVETGLTVEAWVEGLIALLKANEARDDTYLRPYAFARGLVRQMTVPAGQAMESVIDSWGFTSALGSDRSATAITASTRRAGDDVAPPRVKTFSNYGASRLALLEAASAGADTALILGPDGKLSEAPAACLAMVREGALVAPPVTAAVLESITSDTMLHLAQVVLGLTVERRPIDRSELYVADEIFLMGTAYELLPIRALDGRTIGTGAMGPIARALDEAYVDLVRGDASSPFRSVDVTT